MKKYAVQFCFSLVILLLITACTSAAEETPVAITETVAETTTESVQSIPVGEIAISLIEPDALVYQGAFRLPEPSGGSNWEYSGYAMTYYPEGDPAGPNDGYPGSLFALGHAHHQQISEVSIPEPVISAGKNPAELNTAATLQPFNDITNGMFDELEIPRAGLEYLPPQADQTTGKLHFSWGQHFQFEHDPSHGWSGLDLTSPQPAGPWYLGEFTNYITNDYLFEIPSDFADAILGGQPLATGRFRDGHWSGLGPALLAYHPPQTGTPPPAGETLTDVTVLLLYGEHVSGTPEISISPDRKMITFQEADEWSGGAWLTSGEKSAVIFVGTKALGKSWYGYANGVEYPTSGDPNDEIPEEPPWPYNDRGWWSDDIAAQIIFYNPQDLAAVATGSMASWEPQPYASLDLTEYLFDPGYDYEMQKRYLVGAASFDRENGHLYIIEMRVDEEKSIVHVFKVESG